MRNGVAGMLYWRAGCRVVLGADVVALVVDHPLKMIRQSFHACGFLLGLRNQTVALAAMPCKFTSLHHGSF